MYFKVFGSFRITENKAPRIPYTGQYCENQYNQFMSTFPSLYSSLRGLPIRIIKENKETR